MGSPFSFCFRNKKKIPHQPTHCFIQRYVQMYIKETQSTWGPDDGAVVVCTPHRQCPPTSSVARISYTKCVREKKKKRINRPKFCVFDGFYVGCRILKLTTLEPNTM